MPMPQSSPRVCRRCCSNQLAITRALAGFGEERRIVAGIQDFAGRRDEREGTLDQVAASELHRVDAGEAGRLVHQALHQHRGLGPAGAAIMHDRRVRFDKPRRSPRCDRLDAVGARQDARRVPRRHYGAVGQPNGRAGKRGGTSPSRRPSREVASSPSVVAPRPCVAARRSSPRDAHHLTLRRSFNAASATMASSG